MKARSQSSTTGTSPDTAPTLHLTTDTLPMLVSHTYTPAPGAHYQTLLQLGSFTSGLTHHLNNLLTTIVGNAEMLGHQLAPDDPHLNFVKPIRATGWRMSELVQQLVAFSGKSLGIMRIVDLNTLLADNRRHLQRLLGHDIEWVEQLATEPLPIIATPSQINQLLTNLAVNTREATPGPGLCQIETQRIIQTNPTTGDPTDYVQLKITDTGLGMTPNVLAHVYDPFYTTKPAAFGLGLAAVFGIAYQQRGFTRITSTLGRGTTVEVCWPYCPEMPPSV